MVEGRQLGEGPRDAPGVASYVFGRLQWCDVREADVEY